MIETIKRIKIYPEIWFSDPEFYMPTLIDIMTGISIATNSHSNFHTWLMTKYNLSFINEKKLTLNDAIDHAVDWIEQYITEE